ncbi:terpene synthase family protein [Streptomyces sp. 7N604]|uniref:terpene synthase family protein n=1 Tax=Streptomyces sp. 7N604 TaxID=3457415 RepID=UPI003FD05C45
MADPHLAPYRPLMLSERQWILTTQAFAWSMYHCACTRGPAWHAQKAFLAAAFEVHCAPPDSHLPTRLQCAKYAVLFMLLDDCPPPERHHFTDQLRRRRTPTDHELGSHYHSLLQELRSTGLPTAEFETRVEDLCAGMREEDQIAPETLTWEEFHALRLRTIAVLPYISCLRIAHRLTFALEAQEALRSSGIAELAAELTYLANDLASIVRERHPPGVGGHPAEPNFTLLLMHRSHDQEAAVRATADLYNQKADEFWHRGYLIAEAARALSEPNMIRYVELVRHMVNGNVYGNSYLAPHHYPGAPTRMRLLDDIPSLQA